MTEILAEKACTPCRGGDVIRGAIIRNPPDLAAVPERGGDHDHKRMLRLRKSHFA
jgi:hypothetical protein